MATRTYSPLPGTETKISIPISSFNRLSKVVSLYEPPDSALPLPTAPTTILLCSWMNASPKHIAYYTSSYIRLFPGARILIATINTAQFLLQSEKTRRSDIKAAVTALLARPQEDERLLMHAISNGGAKRLYGIAGAFRELVGKPLMPFAYILDSAPGIPQFRRDVHALTVPVKGWSWWAKAPFYVVVYMITCFVYVSVNWMPKWFWHQLVWAPHDASVNHDQIPQKCLRAFVYSKEDKAIDYKNVETHAKLCEDKGYKVIKKRVENAEHAQMFRGKGGEEDYWGFVQKAWKMGYLKENADGV
ncbi:hypothetical protein HYFRA_00002391 [Hymenoscyphus fraxineus]|uniref:Indole-diterpene biosynthesis protein-like protein PaxU n=1 Tax=Hymenoscyphus fraxineus TaxID=746836 RepID=A0A9N9L7F6_9HELO|nr:hypothetical protein HYFRA_00002391 [Hymenoscyphus fraxineus]